MNVEPQLFASLLLITVCISLFLLNKSRLFFRLENNCFFFLFLGFNKKAVTDGHENGDLGTSSESPLEDSASKLDDLHSLYHKNSY